MTSIDELWLDQELIETEALVSLIRSVSTSIESIPETVANQSVALNATTDVLSSWATLFKTSLLGDFDDHAEGRRDPFDKQTRALLCQLEPATGASTVPLGGQAAAGRRSEIFLRGHEAKETQDVYTTGLKPVGPAFKLPKPMSIRDNNPNIALRLPTQSSSSVIKSAVNKSSTIGRPSSSSGSRTSNDTQISLNRSRRRTVHYLPKQLGM